MYIILLTVISSSAFNVAIYVVVFTTPFECDNSTPLIPFACYSNVIYMPCEWLNVKQEFECHANRMGEMLS